MSQSPQTRLSAPRYRSAVAALTFRAAMYSSSIAASVRDVRASPLAISGSRPLTHAREYLAGLGARLGNC